MNALIISEPSEYPAILTNWLGKSLTTISARYLPKLTDMAMAGMKGLLENFLFNSYFIVSAVMISTQDLAMNLTKLLILSLLHCTA